MVFHPMKQAAARANPKPAIAILANGANLVRSQALRRAERLNFSGAVSDQSAIIGANPKISGTIFVQDVNSVRRKRPSVGHVKLDRSHPVEPDQSVISPNPEISVAGLKNGAERHLRQRGDPFND